MSTKTFTCAECGETFPLDPAWSDEDAAAEARATFGTDPTSDPTMAVVCEPCFEAIFGPVDKKRH